MQKPLGIKLISGFMVFWGGALLWVSIWFFWRQIYLSFIFFKTGHGLHHHSLRSEIVLLSGVIYSLCYLLIIVGGIGLWKEKKWAWIASAAFLALIPVSVLVNSFFYRYFQMPFDLRGCGFLLMGDYFIAFYPELVVAILDFLIPIVAVIYLFNQNKNEVYLGGLWKVAIIVLSSAALAVSITIPMLRRAESKKVLQNIVINDPQCPDGQFLDVDKYNRISFVVFNREYRSFRYIGKLLDNHIKLYDGRHLRFSVPECSTQQGCLEYLKQCKDKNDKTIFDNYNIVEDAK